ncbi:MAG TPA: hypothetical protein VKO63_00955, partial [Chitinispirillaceae bacterium]|nr:hypothetical protein [Chitinispirillaceae bacterium]
TFDIKNRIIRDEYGKHYKFKDTYSFDDIYFTYETFDDISISGESYVSQRRIYFIDKKTRKPRCELALNTFCYEYQEMLFFLQELCEPNNTFKVKS